MVAQIQSSWETNPYIYTVAQIPPQKIIVFTKCKSQFEIIPSLNNIIDNTIQKSLDLLSR